MKFNKNLNQLFFRLQEYLYKKYSMLHHIENLEGKTVWVMSPHPDDDAIGCGGAIIKHVLMGHDVRIIYLCSGDKGIKGVRADDSKRIRKSEAQNAAIIMGISLNNLYFLNFDDDSLINHVEKASNKVSDLFKLFPPQIIYLPSFLDNHSDHYATNDVLKKCNLKNTLISAYEVWTPLIPNRIVDISENIAQKENAINAHHSQLKALPYDKAILGLNQYRAKMYTKKNIEYAEAFLALPWNIYITLF
jgi:N-acetylglucosamine malate deacetylase 1